MSQDMEVFDDGGGGLEAIEATKDLSGMDIEEGLNSENIVLRPNFPVPPHLSGKNDFARGVSIADIATDFFDGQSEQGLENDPDGPWQTQKNRKLTKGQSDDPPTHPLDIEKEKPKDITPTQETHEETTPSQSEPTNEQKSTQPTPSNSQTKEKTDKGNNKRDADEANLTPPKNDQKKIHLCKQFFKVYGKCIIYWQSCV